MSTVPMAGGGEPPVLRPPADRPASAVHFGASAFATLTAMAAFIALRAHVLHARDPALFLAVAFAAPLVLAEVTLFGVHRREATGIDWERPFTPSPARVVTKLFGLGATLAPFAVAYWAFPEYAGSFYDPFYDLLARLAPFLLVVTVLYFVVTDGRLRDPHDVYWQLGRLVLGHRVPGARDAILAHYRGWLVKAYFLALFWVWFTRATRNMLAVDVSGDIFSTLSTMRGYDVVYEGMFFVDVLIATVGYAMTYRVLDTHIRSAEPTMLGWVVALVCYEPFFSGLFERQYLHYGGASFASWLAPYPALRWAWAGVILALVAVYVLATVAFGLRFSNLTNRGIVTSGPYRFTKHPAYVTKNLSWWLSSVPFVTSGDVPLAVKHSLLLAAVNFIYFLRARTEERHLSADPAYVAYAMWVEEHGVLRFLSRFSVFRYVPPAPPPVLRGTRPPSE